MQENFRQFRECNVFDNIAVQLLPVSSALRSFVLPWSCLSCGYTFIDLGAASISTTSLGSTSFNHFHDIKMYLVFLI